MNAPLTADRESLLDEAWRLLMAAPVIEHHETTTRCTVCRWQAEVQAFAERRRAAETSVPSRYEQHLAGLLASALAYGAEPLPTTWREEAARYLNERGCPVETSAKPLCSKCGGHQTSTDAGNKQCDACGGTGFALKAGG